MNDKISDEFINAFADDQLTPEEKSRVYPIINNDPELNRRVCEVRKIRDLIQLAYKELPAAPIRKAANRSRWRFNAAAALFLAVGVSLGLGLHRLFKTETPELASATQNSPSAKVLALKAPQQTGETRVVLHISRGDEEQMREVLDMAETLLQHYTQAGTPARVEVIANAGGLNLLRVDTSPFADRISKIKRKYPNVTFAACQSTIDKWRMDFGFQAKLLPEAVLIESGVAEIIMLQQQGWAYIQV